MGLGIDDILISSSQFSPWKWVRDPLLWLSLLSLEEDLAAWSLTQNSGIEHGSLDTFLSLALKLRSNWKIPALPAFTRSHQITLKM